MVVVYTYCIVEPQKGRKKFVGLCQRQATADYKSFDPAHFPSFLPPGRSPQGCVSLLHADIWSSARTVTFMQVRNSE